MDGKLNCVIIDDEKHAVDLLSDYIEAMPNLKLVKYFTDPLKALVDISVDDCIDILFMDMDMPGIGGIELSRAIRFKVKYLVFTTAHSKYAIDAFGVQANDYLLKPISISKFALMINRLAKSEIETRKESPAEDFFFIKSDQSQKYVRVNVKDLIAVEGLNNYVKIHTVHGLNIAYLTVKEVEEKLRGNSSFIRVQRSFVINMDFINKVEGATITLNNKLEVPMGATYKKQFLAVLERKILRSNRNLSE